MKDENGFELVEEAAPGQVDENGFELVEPDSLGTQFQRVGQSLERGIRRAVQSVDVLAEASAGPNTVTGNDRRRALLAMAADPRRLQASIDPTGSLDFSEGENLYGFGAKLEEARRPKETAREARRFDIAQAEEKIREIPKSQAMQEFEEMPDTWGNLISAIARNPVEVIANVTAESLPASLTGIAGGSVGVGASSMASEYAASLVSEAGKMGFDFTDPKAVGKFFDDPEKFRKASDTAMARAGVVGVADALTARLAGRFLAPALGKGVGPVLRGTAKEIGMQMAGGAGGEAVASVVSGEPISIKDVALEAIGELGGAPAETVSNWRGEVQAQEIKRALTGRFVQETMRVSKVGENPGSDLAGLEKEVSGNGQVQGKDQGQDKEVGAWVDGVDWAKVGVVDQSAPMPNETPEAFAERGRKMGAVRAIADQHGVSDMEVRWAPDLTTPEGGTVESWVDPESGRVVINAAAPALQNADTAGPVLREEMAHQLLRSQQGAEAVRKFAIENLTPDIIDTLVQAGYVRSASHTDKTYLEYLANEWIAKSAREQNGFWKELKERVRVFLSRLPGGGFVNLSDQEVGRAILRSLKRSELARVAGSDVHQSIGRASLAMRADQQISSADTSINSGKLPSTFGKVQWKPGTVNVDIGGGRFDNATEFLRGQGVENLVIDPYNRSEEHNLAMIERVIRDGADTATVNNVLNVIQEPMARDLVIRQAAESLKPGGKAYFKIYEGDKSNAPKATPKGWQENRRAETYLEEIGNHFEVVVRKGDIIEASNNAVDRVAYQAYTEIGGAAGRPEAGTPSMPGRASPSNDPAVQAEVDPDTLVLKHPAGSVLLPTQTPNFSFSSAGEITRRRQEWLKAQGRTDVEIRKSIQAVVGAEKIALSIAEINPSQLPESEPAGENPTKAAFNKRVRNPGPFRANSDKLYVVSIDFSSECIRRLDARATAMAIMSQLGRSLTADEATGVVLAFRERGLVAPCLYCYVESPLKKMGELVLNWQRVFDGLEGAGKHRKTVAKLRARGLSGKDIDFATFLSPDQRNPNADPELHDFLWKVVAPQVNRIKGYQEYSGQVFDLKDDFIEYLRRRAGLRFQSSSDFQAEHLLDLMQIIADCELREIPGHVYTKLEDLVLVLAKTNMKVNMSIFGGWDPKSNAPIEDSWQGMSWQRAKELRNLSPHIGTVLVATDDSLIWWALDQGWVDYIIPFHHSGFPAELKEMLSWSDYTSKQKEKWAGNLATLADQRDEAYLAGKKEGQDGKTKAFNNALWDRLMAQFLSNIPQEFRHLVNTETGDPNIRTADYVNTATGSSNVEAGKKYLKICREMGVTPVFEQFAKHPNYIKLKKDFARTDTPMLPLQAKFDKTVVDRLMRSAIESGPVKGKVNQEIVDEMVERIKNAPKGGDNPVSMQMLREGAGSKGNVTLSVEARQNLLARGPLIGPGGKRTGVAPGKADLSMPDWHPMARGGVTPQMSLERRRRFSRQLDASPDVTAEMRRGLGASVWYHPRRNEPDAKAAARIIEMVGGPEKAIGIWRDPNYAMPESVRGFVAQEVIKQLSVRERAARGTNPKESDRLAELAAQFVSTDLFPWQTGMGQAIQSFAAFARLTPSGMLAVYRRTVEGAQNAVRETVGGAVERMAGALQQANQEGVAGLARDPVAQQAAQDAVNAAVENSPAIQDVLRVRAVGALAESPNMRRRLVWAVRRAFVTKVKRKGTSPTLWQRYVESAVNRLEGATRAPRRGQPALLGDFTDAVVSGLREQVRRAFPHPPAGPRPAGITALQQLMSVLGNPERAREIWAATIQALRIAYPADPRVNTLATSPENLYSQEIIGQLVQEEVEDAGTSIAEIVRGQYQLGGGGVSLTDRIVARTGIAPADAAELARVVDQVVRDQFAAERARLAARTRRVRATESRLERVGRTGLVEMGAVQDDEVDTAIRSEMRRLRTSLADVLRERFVDFRQQGQDLAAQFVGRLGLTPPQANVLARTMERRFGALLAERRRSDILRHAAAMPREIRRRLPVERIVELANLGLLNEHAIWEAIAEDLELPRYDPAVALEITRRANDLVELPEGWRRDEAAMELLRFIANQRGINLWDLVMSYWYANTLSGLFTHLLNVTSNLQQVMAGTLFSATMDPRAIPGMIGAMADGFLAGANEAGRALTTGHVTGSRNLMLETGSPLEALGTDTWWRAVLEKWKYVSRALSAADVLFFKTAEAQRIHMLARALARTGGLAGEALEARARDILFGTVVQREQAEILARGEGLSGTALDKRRRELIAQLRPGRLNEDGRQYALRTIFNSTPYGILGWAARWLKAAAAERPELRLVIPFIDVVANVTNESLNYFPPVGFGRAIGAHRVGRLNGQAIDLGTDAGRMDLHDQYAKALVGLLAMGGLALAGAAGLDDDDPEFAVYGAGPDDPNRATLMRATGWRPWSIKIGGRYVGYQDTPLAIPLAVLGTWFDAERWKKDWDKAGLLDRSAFVMMAWPRVVVQRSFLKGLSDFFAGMSRTTSATKASDTAVRSAAGVAGGFMAPNFLRQIDRMLDPQATDQRTMTGALLAQIPFARRLGQPALNALGDPIRSVPSDRWVSPEHPDPLIQTMIAKGAWVSMPTQGDLTDVEFYELVKRRGPMIRQVLAGMDLEGMDDEAAKSAVSRASERLAAQLRVEIRGRRKE